MRLVTWNCRHRLNERKRLALAAVGADVAVIQECGADDDLGEHAVRRLIGTGGGRGLAVAAFGGFRLGVVADRPAVPWCLPVQVVAPDGHALLVVGVWTVAARGWPSYPRQLAAVVEAFADELRTGHVLIAGDTNCAAHGDGRAARAFRAVMADVAATGAVSAYHHLTGDPLGGEREMTLAWRQERYHCDLVIASAPLVHRLRAVAVPSGPIGTLSDHRAVVVDLASGQDAETPAVRGFREWAV